jgi:hypothetical protein
VGQFVSYNEEPQYIYNIVLSALRERKYQRFVSVKAKNGEVIRKGKISPAYHIEVLPHLSQDELDELAKQQLAAGVFEED